MRNVITYTAARLLLFVVTLGVVYVLGARDLLALVLAFLVSGLVSFVLLSKQRDAMSASLSARLAKGEGVADRLDAGSAKEDEGDAEHRPVG
ncbi:DUF4229 domain-containing protein [Nocardiopsis ansamitocini]|uniref:DUF4229 domain-containing protein n=1 Tax=Nocardiopsis ansamitocini TaxID=1670832 RepID=A0A9W6P921_9ACTN|nr:DUF4229 domain-containing protein [Nocardiopsis ansamitocini]GLU49222.1 hypothetical protein Nans01_35730 [Nocardiopsis ansamitocini]